MSSGVETTTDLRPFQVDVPDDGLEDLRRRIAATNWPERETVADESQGVPLAMIQKLARYWMTDYDWRTCEAELNALPQFITEIDGLDIHFIHVRSQHEDALPLIVNHGWPGSIIEQLNSSTSTSTRAVTSPPGSSRNSSRRSFERRSGHFAR